MLDTYVSLPSLYPISLTFRRLSRKRCKIAGKLVLITNRKALSIGTTIGHLEWPWKAKWPLVCVILPNLVVSKAHCIKVVDKAITVDNLRLLRLVGLINVCRETARRPRYKCSITARWKFCSRFINSRLNAQYLPSCRLIC